MTSGAHPAPHLPPYPDDDAAPFWEGTRRGELRVQRCPDTGRLVFPPRPYSPFGQRRRPEWVTVSGRGTVWSFVVPHPPLLEPFTDVAPFNVVLVALDEDPNVRMAGNLVARPGGPIDEIDPAAIEIGMPVQAVFEPVDDELSLVRWMRR